MSKGIKGALLVVPRGVEKAASIAFVRIFIGAFWLFEVTIGHNWKIGGFGSGANPGWWGSGAGDTIREDVATAVSDGTWSWVGWFYETIIAPNAAAFSYFIIALQLLFAVAFIFGFLVRPIALIAIGFDVSVMMLGNSRIPPFFTAAHLFLIVTAAGMYYGVDRILVGRLEHAGGTAARALRFLIDLPLLKARHRVAVLTGASVLALYFFLQIPVRGTGRMQLVALDLAALTGLVALGFYAARFIPSRFAIAAAGLRIFVGYKFLHEIWVRTEPGVNALPGWAGTDAFRELFTTISENHWMPFSWLADNVFLTAVPFWIVVFGVVQFAVGVMLITGWHTRLASAIGLAYLGGLIVMGMTRYAPFVFGLLVAVEAMDGGRALSLDAEEGRRPRYGLPVPQRLVAPIIAVAAANGLVAAVTAFRSGITPDAYVASMGAMTTTMVAIFSGLFAFVGILQRRFPEAIIEDDEEDQAPRALATA